MVKKKIVRRRKLKRGVLYINRIEPLDRSAETMRLEQLRDLRLKLATLSGSMWPVPKFDYGANVQIKPLDWVKARVIELHLLGATRTVEYEVRYFHEGKECRCRVFEDELEACP